ncbi:MAG: rRNA maturation RNase YbeY [Synergistaceae bacterium]|jgi:probable rRNA maturation factor|nr:rRNA maturation RNase YbeY [Synergistaceae bacterium]
MTFEFTFDLKEKSDISHENIKKIENIYTSFLLKKNVIPEAVSYVNVSLTFMDLSNMTILNNEYRHMSEGTDVLSFPFWETEDSFFSPPLDWRFLPLGDIIICPEIIKQNAIEQKKEVINEMVLVIFHGLLHLIGYDHDNNERKQQMWKEQNDLLLEYFTSNT